MLTQAHSAGQATPTPLLPRALVQLRIAKGGLPSTETEQAAPTASWDFLPAPLQPGARY